MFPKLQHTKMPFFKYRLLVQSTVILIVVPLLINMLSADIYNVLQRHCSVAMRYAMVIVAMVIVALIVCGTLNTFYIEGHHSEEKGSSLSRSTTDPQVTKATGSLVRDLSQVIIDHRLDSSGKQVESLASNAVSLADAPGGPDFPSSDSDFIAVQNTFYDWYRQDWKGGWEVKDPQAMMTVHTNESLLDVVEEFQSDIIIQGSKVLLRRLEIGSQTTKSELDKLSSDFYAAMRRARAIDEDCTLQLGSFALLKYTDAGLKSWRLQKQWAPTICCVVRYWDLLDLLPGQTTKWSIRGSNLQNAVLKVSTTEECEILKILHQYQESGEDVLIREEPRLLRHAPPTGGEAVYIYAVKSVEVEEGVTVDVQSKPKNVPRAYWISVVECFRPSHNPWDTVIMVPCVRACVMIMIAIWIMRITHHYDLQQIGNSGISLEENSILSLFLHELPCFFLVLIGAKLILMASSTLRRLIEGLPLGIDKKALLVRLGRFRR